MKTTALLPAFGVLLLTLTSCYVTPVAPVARHPRSPYSPGGRHITPRELAPRSPYSPGGVVVLPREARRVPYHGVHYYTHRGVWYRPQGRGYIVCPRPY